MTQLAFFPKVVIFLWQQNNRAQRQAKWSSLICCSTQTDMTTTAPIQLTQYGRMAEKHWREFLPNRVSELEARGSLQEALLDAEEQTASELYDLTMKYQKEGLTAQQAHDRAWEIVRTRYIFLPPEQNESQ